MLQFKGASSHNYYLCGKLLNNNTLNNVMMRSKRWLGIILVLYALVQTGCENDGPDGINEVPTVPVLITPDNYSLMESPAVTFSWEPSTDPEGEEITYNLQLSTKPDFTSIVFSDQLYAATYQTNLSKGIFYYWRVRARDASNNTSEFSNRQNLFIDEESIENYPPFAPERKFPELDEVIDIDQAQLGWTSYDLDDTDLVYNIYLGTEFGNLKLYAESLQETEVTLNLEEADLYYWRVEVIDPSGQASISPVWWFKSS